MSQHFSPKTVSNGLVLCYDAANIRSFRGVPGTNLIPVINYHYSNTDTTTFKYQQGTEVVNIPFIGRRTVKSAYIYNDYNGGVAPTSNNCCPALYYFFSDRIAVSASTTYTYAIMYKELTGNSPNGNYMYRYEYNSSDVYIGEAGVWNSARRISLGDNWWYAWGQFTTAATCAFLRPYLFHYEYATNNTIYLANASITAGTYVYPPQHMIELNTTRGATNATGGGVIDLARQQGGAELVNTPSFTSGSLGSFSFNGTNQVIISPENSVLNTQTPTVEVWVKTNATTQNGFFFEKGNVNTQYSLFQESTDTVWRMRLNGTLLDMRVATATYINTSSWAHIVATYSSGSRRLYINGNLVSSDSQTGTIDTNANGISIGAYGGYNGSRSYYYNGEIGLVRVYNRALSAAEVRQNFNAIRGRYGV